MISQVMSRRRSCSSAHSFTRIPLLLRLWRPRLALAAPPNVHDVSRGHLPQLLLRLLQQPQPLWLAGRSHHWFLRVSSTVCCVSAQTPIKSWSDCGERAVYGC